MFLNLDKQLSRSLCLTLCIKFIERIKVVNLLRRKKCTPRENPGYAYVFDSGITTDPSID